jgi:hypothetical protein
LMYKYIKNSQLKNSIKGTVSPDLSNNRWFE